MGLILLMLVFALLAWGCYKLSKYLERMAQAMKMRKMQEQAARETLAEAVTDIRDAVVPQPLSGSERLLMANQEILRKEHDRESVDNLLGEIESNFGS